MFFHFPSYHISPQICKKQKKLSIETPEVYLRCSSIWIHWLRIVVTVCCVCLYYCSLRGEWEWISYAMMWMLLSFDSHCFYISAMSCSLLEKRKQLVIATWTFNLTWHSESVIAIHIFIIAIGDTVFSCGCNCSKFIAHGRYLSPITMCVCFPSLLWNTRWIFFSYGITVTVEIK